MTSTTSTPPTAPALRGSPKGASAHGGLERAFVPLPEACLSPLSGAACGTMRALHLPHACLLRTPLAARLA